MYTLELGPDDLSRCRFTLSPLWEVTAAVRTLGMPARHPYHLPWLRAVAARLPDLDLAPLRAVMPPRGYTPDLLTPTPATLLADIETQLDDVLATPLEVADSELSRARTDAAACGVPTAALPEEPAAALRTLARCLTDAWQTLVAPYWPRMRDVLESDISWRARRLAETGLAGLLAEIAPEVSFTQGRLRLDVGHVDELHRLAGRGLVLQPTIFEWPNTVAVLDEPWQPTLVYPARAVGQVWEGLSGRPAGPSGAGAQALGRLLGPTRARVLAALDAPASTTTLCRVLGLPAATVSGHLAVLRDAALVASHRDRRQVLYRRTPLGDALAGD